MRARMVALVAVLPLVWGISAGAQEKTPQPTRDATDVLTVTGCVQPEAAYRAEINEGKGGIAGTGVGAAHEFVLRSARTVSSETLKPIATSGTRFEDVYSLGGNLESELKNAAGHQVAISGYVKVEKSNGTKKVEDLPEMVVIGWHNISDRCAARTGK